MAIERGARSRRAARRALGGWACALALLGTAPARAADCLRFEPASVQLEGELHLKVFPGPPHYKSFDAGDQPESVWLLVLAHPVCIEAAPGDADNAALSDVGVVELVTRAPLSVAWNGKPVTVEGTLYRPRGGHPHADVLLRAAHTSPRS